MKLYNISGWLISVFLFSGCASTDVADSKDVAQDKIYQDYHISYDEENQDFYAEATFRFGGSGGTTLILSHPAKITLNNDDMQGDKYALRGFVYSAKMEKDRTALTFEYRDIKYKKYVNEVKVHMISHLIIPDSFSVKDSLKISWEGNATSDNETITVRINGNESSYLSENFSIKGAKSITIPPGKLAVIKPGNATIQLIRKSSSALKEATETGGNIRVDCYSEKGIVKVVK